MPILCVSVARHFTIRAHRRNHPLYPNLRHPQEPVVFFSNGFSHGRDFSWIESRTIVPYAPSFTFFQKRHLILIQSSSCSTCWFNSETIDSHRGRRWNRSCSWNTKERTRDPNYRRSFPINRLFVSWLYRDSVTIDKTRFLSAPRCSRGGKVDHDSLGKSTWYIFLSLLFWREVNTRYTR